MDVMKFFNKAKNSDDTVVTLCAVAIGVIVGCMFISHEKNERRKEENMVNDLRNFGRQWLLDNGCRNCEATVVSFIENDGSLVSEITVYDSIGNIIYRVTRVDPDIPAEYVEVLISNTLAFDTFENPA